MYDWKQWEKTNEAYLAAALAWLRARLIRLAECRGADPPEHSATADKDESLESATATTHEAALPPPALEILSQRLGLSPFERQVLLLCAAVEFDTRLPALCARAQGDAQKPYPTFALAMDALTDSAWDVLSPERPLRYWRLIEIHQPSGTPLTASILSADERIVSYLKGLNFLDDRLAPLLTRLELSHVPRLPDSQQQVVDTIAACVRQPAGEENEPHTPPVIQLLGPHQASKQLVAQHVAAQLGVELQRMSAELLPSGIGDLETLSRLWQRECLLLPMALYLDARELDVGNPQSDRLATLRRFLAASSGIIFLVTRETQQYLGRPSTSMEIARPTQIEQRSAWTAALGGESEHDAASLSGQFNLCLSVIREVTQVVQQDRTYSASLPASRVWEACRLETRPRLDGLAQRIDAKATRDDIVLPDEEAGLLQQIADQVRHRTTVYDDWGYRAKLNRGLGISALFAGDSGTGKTMAAEVIANDLGLDLFRIDLSAVVNKYIGETEKNLCRLFDAAEEGGVVLFFDEADALFGKRTEVKDSHDRYANIEVNYLLQRMESYRGLAILATNMKGTLDKAFLRRIRFLVDFPFPAAGQRESIWRKTFPRETPLAPLDYKHLARLKLTGGNIHSIALNAAFTAAADGGVVTMPHILTEAKAELRKLNKPINAADFVWREPARASA